MRHNEKSENIARGRRLLVVASQTVGVVAVHRPHRRPNPFISGQSLLFQKTGALGDTMLIPLSKSTWQLLQINVSILVKSNKTFSKEADFVGAKLRNVRPRPFSAFCPPSSKSANLEEIPKMVAYVR